MKWAYWMVVLVGCVRDDLDIGVGGRFSIPGVEDGSLLAPPSATLSLSAPFELVIGEDATFVIGGANPGETIFVGRSVHGPGVGPCPSAISGACPLNIVGPVVLLGSVTADAAGAARLVVTVPATAPAGVTLWVQAAVARGPGGVDSIKSNVDSSTTVTTPTDLYDGRTAQWTGGFDTASAVPYNAPVGVAWTGSQLVIAHSAGTGPFSFFNPGGVFDRNIDPANLIAPGDPAWDGNSLWVNDEFEDLTLHVSATGALLGSIPQPDALTEFRVAHAWDGTHLWGAGGQNYDNSMVFRYNASGHVDRAFAAPCNLFGLTVKDGHLWGLGSDYSSVYLCEMDLDGTPLGIVPVTGLTSLLQGIEWDGTSFWAGGNDPVARRAVRIDLGP